MAERLTQEVAQETADLRALCETLVGALKAQINSLAVNAEASCWCHMWRIDGDNHTEYCVMARDALAQARAGGIGETE